MSSEGAATRKLESRSTSRACQDFGCGSLHLDILQDNIADAHQRSSCTNWAKGVERQFLGLGMGSPFTSTGIGALDSHGFMDRMGKKHCTVWAGLHESPRTAPSKGAKLFHIIVGLVGLAVSALSHTMTSPCPSLLLGL